MNDKVQVNIIGIMCDVKYNVRQADLQIYLIILKLKDVFLNSKQRIFDNDRNIGIEACFF